MKGKNYPPVVPEGKQSLSERDKEVISLIKSRESINRVELQRELSIGSTAVWKLLRKMKEKGLIKKVGTGKNIIYRLHGNRPSEAAQNSSGSESKKLKAEQSKSTEKDMKDGKNV